MTRKLLVLVVGGLALIACGSAWPASPTVVQGRDTPVPLSYFGMHIHNAGGTTPWPNARFGAWRLWDARVAWPQLEPAKGKRDFARLDQYAALADKEGVQLLFPLGLSPAWASARPTEPSGYGPGNMAEPRDLEDWRNFVRTVGTRYKGRIRLWELWNEINDAKRFYSGSLETMVEMSRIAYTELKSIDPANVVLSPSITGPYKESLDVLDRYLAAGGGKYADAVAYHFYLLQGRKPEALQDYIGRVRAVMRKHGLEAKPIWNTESGLRVVNDDGTAEAMKLNDEVWPKLSRELGAAYMARSLIVGWVSGLDRFFSYAWDNTAYGLMEPKSKEPKPAGLAYGQIARWLNGKILRRCEIGQDAVWVCELENSQGRRAWIVWNATDRDGVYAIDRKMEIAETMSLEGKTAQVSSGTANMKISASPILLAQAGF